MLKHKTFIVILTGTFIVLFFSGPLFAQISELRSIAEIEKMEKITMAPDERITRPSVEYYSQNYRDPFEGVTVAEIPTEAVLEEVPELTIEGIVWGGKFPQAIINSTVVKAGDMIEGVRIISIDKYGITAFYEGKQFRLPSPAAGSPAPQ